jgi:hypothetical protein
MAPNSIDLSNSSNDTTNNLIFGLNSSQIDVNADVDRLARRLSETHLPTGTEANNEVLAKDHRTPSHGEVKKA